jgi:ornithine cyclodeaminase
VCTKIDAVEIVRQVLKLHADKKTTLPDEAYLGWQTSAGTAARSLALPGALWGDEPAIGMKIINSSLANPDAGLPRAQGMTLIFDQETARPVAVMEAAYISALRTTAYTALSVDLLASRTEEIAVIGCGALGRFHVQMLADRLPSSRFALYDSNQERCRTAVEELVGTGVIAQNMSIARAAIEAADIVVTTTTVTEGYVQYDWLRPGALIAHVSLDDVLPEVVEKADLVIVDDWNLVSADGRRLLGRMFRSGQITGPADDPAEPSPGRRVDATMADIATGRHAGRANDEQIILSNPFGMGILDIAIAAEVWRLSRHTNIGIELPI